MTFTIGCDPEIFLVDEEGRPVSAHGVIPGTKYKPHPVAKGAIQVDGLAVEFNTDPVPYNDFDAFNRNVITVMGKLHEEVRKKHPNLKFRITPTQDFDQAYLDAQPDEAKELGCDPDFNAYTLEANPRPEGSVPFRTGSGHLHVGWGADIPVDNQEHLEICAGFVKMLDATVGLAMTVLDTDPRRRELYGKAGAFRPKPYGVEYRTPSNVWLTSKAHRKLVFSLINHAVSYMRNGSSVQRLTGLTETQIQSVINNGDVKEARRIVKSRYFPWNSEYNSLLGVK